MSFDIRIRLNQIIEKILSPEFLNSQGLGNEIGFWIFDYNPEDELEVRSYLQLLETSLPNKKPDLKFLNINLLQAVNDYLKERNLLQKAIEMQKNKGDDAVIKALKGPLHMDKFAPYIVEKYATAEQDMVILSGMGSVWPLMRGHNLLNSLHALLGHQPVILFYPGHYDGQAMTLFGKIPSNNYYRAFRLIP